MPSEPTDKLLWQVRCWHETVKLLDDLCAWETRSRQEELDLLIRREHMAVMKRLESEGKVEFVSTACTVCGEPAVHIVNCKQETKDVNC